MPSIPSKESQLKSKFKKRVMDLRAGCTSGLTEAYLDGLSLKQLRDLHLIARTMQIKKPL
jgi:hypothetical protein